MIETFLLASGERLSFVVEDNVWTMMPGLRNWLGTNRPDITIDGNLLTLVSSSAIMTFNFVKHESEVW